MADHLIPTLDLSPFFKEDDEDCKKAAMEVITQACSNYGFFQVVNHGVPVELLQQALELSRIFFDFSDEEKLKSSPASDAPLPTGYSRDPQNSRDKKEYLLMFPPDSSFNFFPRNPPELKKVFEDVFSHLVKTGGLLDSIVNKCLGLPPNFLNEFNHDRSWDFMVAIRYFPATETENNGLTEHEDGNSITLVFQDEACGLEVCKHGEWIPVIPSKEALVVNLGDSIQVLSNKKFKSATHRVVRPQGRSRYSFAFFYNLEGEKWIEPLPQFTKDIGEPPKYRGFQLKEYQELRMRNKTHPPARLEDEIRITHYEIAPSN